MTRTAKIGSETGPQGFGQIPVLTELRMKVYNHEPKAICTSASLQADATSCAATNPDISLGSTEFDLNEGDAVSKKTLVRPSPRATIIFPCCSGMPCPCVFRQHHAAFLILTRVMWSTVLCEVPVHLSI